MNMQCTRKQTVTTTIEFAFTFSLMLVAIWATISYAMPFFLNQNMKHMVSEAVREARAASETNIASAATSADIAQAHSNYLLILQNLAN